MNAWRLPSSHADHAVAPVPAHVQERVQPAWPSRLRIPDPHPLYVWKKSLTLGTRLSCPIHQPGAAKSLSPRRTRPVTEDAPVDLAGAVSMMEYFCVAPIRNPPCVAIVAGRATLVGIIEP